MTNYEFAQIMEMTGFHISMESGITWVHTKNPNFIIIDNPHKDSCELHLPIYRRGDDFYLYYFEHEFTNLSKMNSIEFKKKIEGITDYAYSLYMDVNRHIDAISTKMETKAKRLGMLTVTSKR